MKIDWLSNTSYLLLNPRLSSPVSILWKDISNCSEFPAHFWIATSGSAEAKLVGLHKKSILSSAQAVNEHLQVTSKDIWMNPLPYFHVGGLGIWARGYLSSSTVHEYLDKWNPHLFHQRISEKKVTLTALVPTQVYDLVLNQLSAPKCLRAVIVGGGALLETLRIKARQLGWPLLPSYGLTECASQVATVNLNSLMVEDTNPSLEILGHMNVKIDASGCICMKSPSLLSAYASLSQDKIHFAIPLSNGWFTSQDKGILSGKSLQIIGRQSDFIKIGGESVEFFHLAKIFEKIKLEMKISFDVVIDALPDARLGHSIHLFSTDHQIDELCREYNDHVMPYERIRKIHYLSSIPRSSLGKLLKAELIKKIEE